MSSLLLPINQQIHGILKFFFILICLNIEIGKVTITKYSIKLLLLTTDNSGGIGSWVIQMYRRRIQWNPTRPVNDGGKRPNQEPMCERVPEKLWMRSLAFSSLLCLRQGSYRSELRRRTRIWRQGSRNENMQCVKNRVQSNQIVI